MMLQALLKYAERRSREDPAFSDPDLEPVKLHWLIPLTEGGTLSGSPIPLTTFEGKKKIVFQARRPATSVNEISVRSLEKAKSYFLCDTLERVLLLGDEGCESSDPLVLARHRYFKRLLAEASLESPKDIQAIIAFLENPDEMGRCRALLEQIKADGSENCTFQVQGRGRSVLDDEALISFWRKRRTAADKKCGPDQVCLVTGELAQTIETTEKVKGVGGQDTNLISANEKAFQSFGLEQAKNSPISARAEKLTRAALNELISKALRVGEKQTVYYLHWTREPVSTDVFALLESADEAGVRNLLTAPRTGHAPTELQTNAYYATSLSGNGGRIVVRDWLESSVPEVEANVRAWFDHLTVANERDGRTRSAFGLYTLLATIVPRKKNKPDFDKLPPQLPTQLLRAALSGSALPPALLAAAVARQNLGGESKLNPARIALIKLHIVRNHSTNPKTRKTMSDQLKRLDPNSTDIAYLCGQLFAAVGRLQLLALGKVGTSLAERTYGGVATRPASTLGPIFTKVPAYLKKANSRFPGSGTNKQKELETICARIDAVNKAEGRLGFPPLLGLEEQGRFALGYYCQLAQYRADRAESEIEEKAEELPLENE